MKNLLKTIGYCLALLGLWISTPFFLIFRGIGRLVGILFGRIHGAYIAIRLIHEGSKLINREEYKTPEEFTSAAVRAGLCQADWISKEDRRLVMEYLDEREENA